MLLAVALCATALGAEAQREWRVDGALSRVQPAGATRKTAATIAAMGGQQIGAVSPFLAANATIAGDSVAAAQLSAGVGVIPPWSNRAPFDIGAIVALYGIAAGDRGQSRAAYVRQQILGENSGYWIGAAIGAIERTESFHSDAADIGVWLVARRARFTFGMSTTRTNDRDVFRNTAMPLDESARTVRVADGLFAVQFAGDRLEVEGVIGLRLAVEGLSGSRDFSSIAVGWRLTPSLHAVVSGGSQLADPLRGTPEWRYVSAGFRVHSSVPRSPFPSGRVAPAVRVSRLDGGRAMIVVAAPATAATVEIAGTFTGWQPVALERGAEGWHTTIVAAAGPHQVQVRINGADWRPPANLPAVSDEFGQKSGLIILP